MVVRPCVFFSVILAAILTVPAGVFASDVFCCVVSCASYMSSVCDHGNNMAHVYCEWVRVDGHVLNDAQDIDRKRVETVHTSQDLGSNGVHIRPPLGIRCLTAATFCLAFIFFVLFS